jgi:hypothetical protein
LFLVSTSQSATHLAYFMGLNRLFL